MKDIRKKQKDIHISEIKTTYDDSFNPFANINVYLIAKLKIVFFLKCFWKIEKYYYSNFLFYFFVKKMGGDIGTPTISW